MVEGRGHLGGLLYLVASFPGLREDGADGALRTYMTRRSAFRHAAVRLTRVVGLGLCREGEREIGIKLTALDYINGF